MKIVRTILFISILLLLCVRCATIPAGEKGIIAEYPPSLVIGSKFVWQITDPSTGKAYTETWVVREKKKHLTERGEGKTVYWVETSLKHKGENVFNLYDMELNDVAKFLGGGYKVRTFEPCMKLFKWPLKVGKKWNSAYFFQDYFMGERITPPRYPIAVEIVSYEEVKVPAGTFNAFKISWKEYFFFYKETFWYSPSIGFIVKREKELIGNDKRVEKILGELLEYNIPQK